MGPGPSLQACLYGTSPANARRRAPLPRTFRPLLFSCFFWRVPKKFPSDLFVQKRAITSRCGCYDVAHLYRNDIANCFTEEKAHVRNVSWRKRNKPLLQSENRIKSRRRGWHHGGGHVFARNRFDHEFGNFLSLGGRRMKSFLKWRSAAIRKQNSGPFFSRRKFKGRCLYKNEAMHVYKRGPLVTWLVGLLPPKTCLA